jgi:hypothetical protein
LIVANFEDKSLSGLVRTFPRGVVFVAGEKPL